MGYKEAARTVWQGLGKPREQDGSENRLGVGGKCCRAPEVRAGHGRALCVREKQPCRLQSKQCPDGNDGGWKGLQKARWV